MISSKSNSLVSTMYSSENGEHSKAVIILLHGAGAGNRHPFMEFHGQALAKRNYLVHSLNFPYMQTAYAENKKKPPNRVPALLEFVSEQVNLVLKQTSLPIFIVGKSMGGRVASIFASQNKSIGGVVALGYPFHPPGKPEKLNERMAHFPDVDLPFKIIQGERDTFGNKSEISSLEFPKSISIAWLKDGDHSFKPRKSSGETEEGHWHTSVELIDQFIMDNI